MNYSVDDSVIVAYTQECIAECQIMIEKYSVLENLPSNNPRFSKLLENTLENENKNIIQRMIDNFKALIKKVVNWISNAIQMMVNTLRSFTDGSRKYKNVKILARANIIQLDRIVEQIRTALKELIDIDIDNLAKVLSAYNTPHINIDGYTKSLSKYDDMQIDDILDTLFGKIVEVSGIDVYMLQKAAAEASRAQKTLDDLEIHYMTELSKLRYLSNDITTRAIVKINMFFSKNVGLITSLLIHACKIGAKATNDLMHTPHKE